MLALVALMALLVPREPLALDQSWSEEELGGLPPVLSSGLLRKRHRLNSRPDGSCVFLNEQDRCRIHEKFGYDAKPLPCRLFPFVLVPAGDHWRVGLRYACPSAAASKGRALPEHQPALAAFAAALAEREKLTPQPDGTLNAPPPLDQGGHHVGSGSGIEGGGHSSSTD